MAAPQSLPSAQTLAYLTSAQLQQMKSFASGMYALCCAAETQQNRDVSTSRPPRGKEKRTLPADQQLKLIEKRSKTLHSKK